MANLTKRVVESLPPPASGDVLAWDDAWADFICQQLNESFGYVVVGLNKKALIEELASQPDELTLRIVHAQETERALRKELRNPVIDSTAQESKPSLITYGR